MSKNITSVKTKNMKKVTKIFGAKDWVELAKVIPEEQERGFDLMCAPIWTGGSYTVLMQERDKPVDHSVRTSLKAEWGPLPEAVQEVKTLDQAVLVLTLAIGRIQAMSGGQWVFNIQGFIDWIKERPDQRYEQALALDRCLVFFDQSPEAATLRKELNKVYVWLRCESKKEGTITGAELVEATSQKQHKDSSRIAGKTLEEYFRQLERVEDQPADQTNPVYLLKLLRQAKEWLLVLGQITSANPFKDSKARQ
jgi:hypothetical protein